MKISEDQLKLVLKNVADNLNMKQWSYIRSETDKTIKNYFGILVPVTLVRTGNEEVRKPLYVKFAPTDIIQLKSTVEHLYKAEEYTYSHLIPIYKRITNVDINTFIPECFYADLEKNNEVIVLKDVRSDGFKRYDEKAVLDTLHVRLSLEVLAKFHALSIIFKKKGGEFDNIRMKPFTDKFIESYFSAIKTSIQTHVRLFSGTIYEGFLKRLASDLAYFVISSTTEATILVYGHGDLWKENILFKYINNNPKQACLVDFQMTRIMSPAQDILHLLLTSVEVTDINQHNEYLNVYLDTLKHILNENGLYNPYSADNLKHDMKVVAPYAVAIAAMSFSLWLGLEIEYILENKSNIKDYDKNTILFKNTIINILEQLNAFGYIQL